MSLYRVSFFKRLANSIGHEIEACQRIIEIRAANRGNALKAACRRFAAHAGIKSWMQHADTAKVECLDDEKKTRSDPSSYPTVPDVSKKKTRRKRPYESP